MSAPLWTSRNAAAATGGTTGTWAATGVSIDTRSLEPGDLFVALKDQRDGHDFVAAALDAGAAAALVSRVPDGVTDTDRLLIVPDVLKALEALAAAARARTGAKVVAVTGSVGKTSTKEMLRAALAGQGHVHAAEKSFNNHWGVPLTLARMPVETDFAVIEIGMNHAGEISPLSQLARPHVAVITTVAEVHMAAFKDLRGVARAKAEIFDGLEPGGTAVLNRDIRMYPLLARRARSRGAKLFRFGMAGRPELRLQRCRVADSTTIVSLTLDRERFSVRIGAPGKHFAVNAMAALGAVEAIGADLAQAAIGLASWRPPQGRGTRHRISIGTAKLDGAILLIDDSYNANPTSMEAALEVLAAAPVEDGVGHIARGRRIAVIGDMLELGPAEARQHADLARLPAMAAIDRVHTVGPLSRATHEALPVGKRGAHFPDSTAAAAAIGRLLDAGDVVMLKASLGTRLAPVVEAIKKLGETGADNDED